MGVVPVKQILLALAANPALLPEHVDALIVTDVPRDSGHPPGASGRPDHVLRHRLSPVDRDLPRSKVAR